MLTIDRDKAMKGLECCIKGECGKRCPYYAINCRLTLFDDITAYIQRLEALLAIFQMLGEERQKSEPVQNGRWGKYGKTRHKIVCSLCGCPAPFKKQKTDYHIRKQKPGHLIRWESNYCPNCGAKMDAEVKT